MRASAPISTAADASRGGSPRTVTQAVLASGPGHQVRALSTGGLAVARRSPGVPSHAAYQAWLSGCSQGCPLYAGIPASAPYRSKRSAVHRDHRCGFVPFCQPRLAALIRTSIPVRFVAKSLAAQLVPPELREMPSQKFASVTGAWEQQVVGQFWHGTDHRAASVRSCVSPLTCVLSLNGQAQRC